MTGRIYGCVEAGGTKFVLGLVDEKRAVLAETRIATTTPAQTLNAALAWFRDAAAVHGFPSAFGIASFGPASVDPAVPDWGRITTTPKPGWSGTDMVGPFGEGFAVPVGFDTDVNGAAIAESLWGSATGERVAVYLTLGTGIGGGAVVGGIPLRGRSHPEMGHVPVQRHADDHGFGGICPFHGDCLEGMASGPAIQARWGKPLSDLPPDHVGHRIIADYIAQLCVMLAAILSPGRIVIGGGVAKTPGLLEHVRAGAERRANGYFPGFDPTIIVAPGLGERAGLLGAFALAEMASRAPR